MSSTNTFPMLDGPPISQEQAVGVYRMYSCLFRNGQSLAQIAARGGFGHEEIAYIQRKHDAEKVANRCTCPQLEFTPTTAPFRNG